MNLFFAGPRTGMRAGGLFTGFIPFMLKALNSGAFSGT